MYNCFVDRSGLYGAIFAHLAKVKGETVLVFGKDVDGNELAKMVISREDSSTWRPGVETYYLINEKKNSKRYSQYKAFTDKKAIIIFDGRLGERKYYDMDQVIATVLDRCEHIWGGTGE